MRHFCLFFLAIFVKGQPFPVADEHTSANNYSFTVIHNYAAPQPKNQQDNTLLTSLLLRALLARQYDASATRATPIPPWEEGSNFDPFANDPIFDRRSLNK